MGHDAHGNRYVASEMKAMVPVCHTIKIFQAGSYLWLQDGEIRAYYQSDWLNYENLKENTTDASALRTELEDAVKSHLMSDVPYGVFLSGGLDSSVISEIHFTVQEGVDAIRDVTYHIETYDVTTIRASTPMYLMSLKIKAMGIKMVLSGEGADEVFGDYLYFHKAPNTREFYNPKDKWKNTLFMNVLSPICQASSVAWRQKEQISDGVGYSWIDILKGGGCTADQRSTARNRAFPLPITHTDLKRRLPVP